jgi:uncharacterized protein YjbI with pentapeptide repeats
VGGDVNRRRSRRPVRAGGFAAVVAVLLLLAAPAEGVVGPVGPGAVRGASTTSGTSSTEELEEAKLREEIRQLELQNARTSGLLGWLLTAGPLVTVVVGVGGLLVTVWQQSRQLVAARVAADEQARQWAVAAEQQRMQLVHQQEVEEAARQRDHVRRFDERLTSVATGISDPSIGAQLNAAALLGLFVKPTEAALHPDLLNVVVANLKAVPDVRVGDLLRRHLATLLRFLLDPAREPAHDFGGRLDLTRLDLRDIDLAGLRAGPTQVDLFGSDLSGARMRGCVLDGVLGGRAVLDGTVLAEAWLREARMVGATAATRPADFRGAHLESAKLQDAVLPGARFEGAHLQSAHLERADLRGARFTGADLADARFTGATLDEEAIRTLASALRWRQAFFDEAVVQRLTRASGEEAGGP